MNAPRFYPLTAEDLRRAHDLISGDLHNFSATMRLIEADPNLSAPRKRDFREMYAADVARERRFTKAVALANDQARAPNFAGALAHAVDSLLAVAETYEPQIDSLTMRGAITEGRIALAHYRKAKRQGPRHDPR